MINLLNPEAIIIAGGFAARACDLLIKPLLNGIKAKTQPWIKDDINIIQSELAEYIAARGAAAIALDKSFDDLF